MPNPTTTAQPDWSAENADTRFKDEAAQRTTRALRAILTAMWVIVALGAVASILVAGNRLASLIIVAVLVVEQLAVTYLMRTNRIQAASLTLMTTIWLILTGAAVAFGGVNSPTVAFFVVIIVIGGVLLGQRGAIVAAGLSIVSLTAMLLLGENNLMPPPVAPVTPVDRWINFTLSSILTATLFYLAVRSLNDALTLARRNEQAQLASNRELLTIRESLEERVAERTAQLQVSAEVSRVVSSILDPDELISQVVNLITQRFGLYYAAVFLTDATGQYAVLRDATGEAGRQLKERGHQLEVAGQSMVGMAIRTREPRLAMDAEKDARRFANPLLTDTRSEIALPLVAGNQVLGALDVQSRRAGVFDEGTVAVLSGLANQVAIALNTARAYQAARVDALQATALFETSQTTGFLGEDLTSAVNRLFGVVAQRADFDMWLAARYDADHETYTILTAYDANEPAPLEDAGQTIQIDRAAPTPAALAMLAREVVVIDDPDRDIRLAGLPEETRLTLGKIVSAPAMLGNRVLGVIVLGRTRDKDDTGPRDVQMGQALASQLAMTIANRELFDQAQTTAAELNQLMRLYTRQGWEDYTQSRATRVIEHEYHRSDAAPLNPNVIPQAEQAARTGQLESVAFDGQAVFGVPITLRGEVLGTLQVQDDKDRKWTDDELATLQAVSDQVAQSIEAARLLAQSESNLLETTTLYEVSRALSTAPSLTEALSLFVKTIHRRLKADQVALVLFDEAHGYGTLIAEAVPSPDGSAVQLPMHGNPSYDILAETKRPINISDVDHHPATANIVDLLQVRRVKSMLIVPLLVGTKLIGSFGVDSQSQRNFSEQEMAFCETLARQAAGTIERYQLFEQTQTSLEETRALYQASRGIAAAQTPTEILRAISDSLAAPHVDRVMLALHDPDSLATNPAIDVVAAWERGVEPSGVVGDRWTAAQIPLIARYFSEPIVLPNVEQATEIDPLSRRIFSTIIGTQAAVIVPLLAGGRSLGWVVIESLHGPHPFDEQEVRRYRTLAGQATVALENRRLFQDVEARVNELTVLTRIGRRLASTLELDEVLSLIVEESINATEARQASIALYNETENALEVRVMRGYTPEMEQTTLGALIRPGQGLHGRLLTTGRAVLVADVKVDADYRAVNANTRSEFIVPIRQGELLLGALNLESPKLHAFAETDVRLIEALADQVAVAITNARAYEAERQAVERMREVDRLKTQFLANMSHELRTPLNSIIGFSRVILRGIDGPISELQQTDLTSIYNSGQHLLSLINNILDLSKIEAGKMELSIEPLDLRDIAKSVMATAIALVKDKRVRLEQDVPDDLPTVMADQTRVRQIMLNLVSNAAKFTETGSITLRVTPYPKEVYVSVTDTGIGVANDKLEHIFEEFTQADASTTRRYGGTGLGLAITKKFVEMHKGRIWVESQVGAGSTFTFTLPREQAIIEEPAPAISLPTDLEARGEGKKLVMCIDDDPGVITLYKRYLEKQGYQVIGLTDSTKAVEEARRLLPFAITLDVLMPNRDGWDVLADLKKTPEIANTPIVLCSIIHDKTRGYTLGAADYLVKPITEGELLGALERVRHTTDVRRVLVVDDEPDALNLLTRLLEAEPGYEVITALGGAAALAAIQADKPDLLILDLMMPDIDGFAVLDSVKSSTLTRHIPVIIVTAKELTADDRARLQGKTVALFNKGMFTAEQLLTDIVTALQAMNGATVTVLAA